MIVCHRIQGYYKIFQWTKFENRLRFNRIMAMSLVPRFNGQHVHCVLKKLRPCCFCCNLFGPKPILIIFGRNGDNGLCNIKLFTYLMLSFAVGYQLKCFEIQCRYLFLVCCALIQLTSMLDFDDLIQQWLFCSWTSATCTADDKASTDHFFTIRYEMLF